MISIVWLIYSLPKAFTYGETLNPKLVAFSISVGIAVGILVAGFALELLSNEIKKRSRRARPGD